MNLRKKIFKEYEKKKNKHPSVKIGWGDLGVMDWLEVIFNLGVGIFTETLMLNSSSYSNCTYQIKNQIGNF